jgi:hypothetical protein
MLAFQQVDKLKDDNRKKQEIINQLLSQQQKYSDNFRHDDCKLKLPIRHLANDDVQQQQQMMYNSACEMIQHQSMQLKMENDNSNVMQSSEMESLYKEDQLGADRSSPASTYPNTTSSMMLNDPGK